MKLYHDDISSSERYKYLSKGMLFVTVKPLFLRIVISGGSLRASWPLTEDDCKNILLLHWPNWRNLSEIKGDDISWSDKLQEFLLNDSCQKITPKLSGY
jgi:hypothetical protein